jgi:ABC-type transporter MlaC component
MRLTEDQIREIVRDEMKKIVDVKEVTAATMAGGVWQEGSDGCSQGLEI